MSTTEAQAHLQVPARHVPVPRSLSAHAQAVLGMGRREAAPMPLPDDLDGWRTWIATQDESLLPMLEASASAVPAAVRTLDLDGLRVFDIVLHDGADDGNVVLYIHGGGLVLGGGDCCQAMATMAAAQLGAHVWAIDYRMPPDHPYPAALDDCVAAYRALLEDHDARQIIVHGTSAGGNLAPALILRARDEGLPLPAGAILVSPEIDLTESGDSFRTNLGVDTILTEGLMSANLLYAGGHALDDPYLSPLFGDFTKGFPPTFLLTGTRDLFLSNTVRMHRALRGAGVHAELHVMEAAPHGGFYGSPEDVELDLEIRRFMTELWSEAPTQAPVLRS